MAKTFNLNPGADTTLVAAATKAAMANVPKDLSGTFQNMSASYEKTMSTIGTSFKQAAVNIGKMGRKAIDTAIYNQQNINKGFSTEILVEKEILGSKTEEQAKEVGKKEEEGALITTDPSDDPTGGVGTTTVKTTIGDELKNIRKELFDLYLKTDPESRKRKAELRNKRDQFHNDIKFLENADNFSDELLTSNNADLNATGEFNLFMKQAMNAYKTKTGKINDPKSDYNGFEAVLTRDENDKLAFMFKDANGDFITGKDDDLKPTSSPGEKPFVLTMDKTNNLIKTKLDSTTVNNINKAFADLEKRGSYAGTEYMGDQFVNRLRPLFEDEGTLHKLIRMPMGNNGTSLEHNLNNLSAESAEIFTTLSGATLQKMLDEGYITDTGEKGITKEDFIGSSVAVSNYKKVKNAILDPDNDFYDQQATTQIALEHVKRTGEVFHLAGAARRKKNTNTGDGDGGRGSGTDTKLPFATRQNYYLTKAQKDAGFSAPSQVTGDTFNNVLSILESGEVNVGKDGIWNVDTETNIWTRKSDGATMSGNSMLRALQPIAKAPDGYEGGLSLIIGPDITKSNAFSKFRGTEGDTSSDDEKETVTKKYLSKDKIKKFNSLADQIAQEGKAGAASGKFMLDYDIEVRVRDRLIKHFKGYPVDLKVIGGDKMQIIYTLQNGEKMTHNFIIDRLREKSRKKDEKALIKWLKGVIKTDSKLKI